MGHDHGATCVCVADHNPNPVELNLHHIWPKASGGPDADWNLVWLCPTSHVNVHELLREWFRAGGEPAWVIRSRFNPYVRAIAEDGWRWTIDPESRPVRAIAEDGWRRTIDLEVLGG